MQTSVLQEPDIGGICENITKNAEEKLAELEPKPTGQHSHHHNLHRHRQQHHHREGSRHSKNENQQAPSETQRHHPHSGRRHRVFGHNRHDQTGSHAQVDTVPQGESVEITQDKKLWKKGKNSCKNQLTWNWQTASDSTSSSWCCHCRHLLFEELGNSVTWQCRGALPNSCRWHGQLSAEDITESWQWRLLTAAWQSPAAGASETSDTWQWQEKARNWAWKTN